jgi:hypothetical protein
MWGAIICYVKKVGNFAIFPLTFTVITDFLYKYVSFIVTTIKLPENIHPQANKSATDRLKPFKTFCVLTT